jgi:hypothetical protein
MKPVARVERSETREQRSRLSPRPSGLPCLRCNLSEIPRGILLSPRRYETFSRGRTFSIGIWPKPKRSAPEAGMGGRKRSCRNEAATLHKVMQEAIGCELQKRYQPENEVPHDLLVLMMQINEDSARGQE